MEHPDTKAIYLFTEDPLLRKAAHTGAGFTLSIVSAIINPSSGGTDFHNFLAASDLICPTDSGGIQEEAPARANR